MEKLDVICVSWLSRPRKRSAKQEKKPAVKKMADFFCETKFALIFALLSAENQLIKVKREFSSAGSEHLPYKQRVGGSNPSTPTLQIQHLHDNG